MLFDFMYYNPTRIHFGKDSLSSLKEEIENFGETILLLYGKNSIKKIGLYDKVIKILKDNGKKSYRTFWSYGKSYLRKSVRGWKTCT